MIAVLLFVAVATLAVIGASYILGYVRVEFGDAAPPRTVAAPVTSEESAPVADGPDAPPMAEPEPAPPIRIVTPSPPPPPPSPPDPEPATDPEPVASAPRIVGGAGITPGPVSREDLPREATPPPEPPAPELPRWTAFRRVTVVEAGRLDLGKRSVTLAGLVSADPDRRCRVAVGAAEQPCAFLALQAMRQRIRGLGVECLLSKDGGADSPTIPCRIGKTDLSLWLVGQGWAEPDVDAPASYQQAEKAARCARKGLWLEATPPSDCPGR
ncbi:thermonuclease family protein [Kaistia algarum]|uniref:thermonuclease family protein n=1 Tax=Kaistia algarum TaxID=2083279 RepID=UPI0010570841|nr:hypothetical protein [Kaistia algarum]MCX5513388.1 hypothetical protein [Kaistia algarum]